MEDYEIWFKTEMYDLPKRCQDCEYDIRKTSSMQCLHTFGACPLAKVATREKRLEILADCFNEYFHDRIIAMKEAERVLDLMEIKIE